MKPITRVLVLPVILLMAGACNNIVTPIAPSFEVGEPNWELSLDSEAYQEMQSDPRRVDTRDLLAANPYLAMDMLEERLGGAQPLQKVMMLWGLYDFLGMERSHNPDIRQHAASILVEEYANRDQPGGVGADSLFAFEWVFRERDLVATPINLKAQLALRDRFNRGPEHLHGMDMWFLGIHRVPGSLQLAQRILSEYRAYLTQGNRPRSGAYRSARLPLVQGIERPWPPVREVERPSPLPLVQENVFFSYLVEAIEFDANLLVQMYASFSPTSRANSLYWLSFVDQDPVDQYLLWVAYSHPRAENMYISDALTRRTAQRVRQPEQLPEEVVSVMLEYAAVDALIRRHSEYPYPDFLDQDSTTISNAVHQGREWINDNIDNNYLRYVGVLSM